MNEAVQITNKKRSAWNKGLKGISGTDHAQWKGDSVTYRTIHTWVTWHKGKASYCSFNKTHTPDVFGRFEWANVSGEYKRDLNDYVSLCRSCHSKYDFTEKVREHLRRINYGNKNACKRIAQYTLKGEFIREFASMADASLSIGLNRKALTNAFNKDRKIVGGYLWSLI